MGEVEQVIELSSDIDTLVVLGDPHGDIDGVRAILEQTRDLRALVVCVGDVVGYESAAKCSTLCALFEELKIPTVQGNHEDWLGPYGELMFTPDRNARCLSLEAQAWVASLPHQIRFVREGETEPLALMVHAIRDPHWDWINPDNAAMLVRSLGSPRLLLSGHSHRPKFIEISNAGVDHAPFDFVQNRVLTRTVPKLGSLVVDAGSIGRPDPTEVGHPKEVQYGDRYGTYAVVDLAQGSVSLRCLEKRSHPIL